MLLEGPFVLAPDPIDSDCSHYDNLGGPTLTLPVLVHDRSDDSFLVFSQTCGIVIWDSQAGDSYSWDGDTLSVTSNGAVTTFAAEDVNAIDCSIYDA